MHHLAKEVIGLQNASSLNSLISYLSKKKVVMLGEASHGTKEYYLWRRIISEILLRDHGFNFIAVEGDYPDCSKVNEWIKGGELDPLDENTSATSALRSFNRWPTWMWANTEVLELMKSMKNINIHRSEETKVGFYGLDVYSMFDSADEVKRRCHQIDKNLEKYVDEHYQCLESFHKNERKYLEYLSLYPEHIKSQVSQVLTKLLAERLDGIDRTKDKRLFDSQQNARIVVNADKYYRTMIFGENSWNVRDTHMIDTLDRLREFPIKDAKAIIWAHNTHIGDHRFTLMDSRGEVNIGGLARMRYGEENVGLVGFSTFKGSVLASSSWGKPVELMKVPNARPDSIDYFLHSVSAESTEPAFYFVVKDLSKDAKDAIIAKKGQRAIGVVYSPDQEYGNYVSTALTRRYDAVIFINKTSALIALKKDGGVLEEEMNPEEVRVG